MACADELACPATCLVEQMQRVAQGYEAHIQIDQGAQTIVRVAQFIRGFGQLVRDKAQVLALVLAFLGSLRGASALASEYLVDDCDDLLGLAGFRQNPRYAGSRCQPLGFTHVIVRSTENHRCRCNLRFGAQLAHEFVAIHGRHQDVADDECGALRAYQRKCIAPVTGLEHAVTLHAECSTQQLTIERTIVDDKDG